MRGCGASDMKGGVAVALELVRELAGREPGTVDVALLLFGREELPPSFDPLPALFDGCPLVHETALAVLLEPTDLEIQAGCVGNVTARVTFHGRSGHSARPWLAVNAIHRAIDGLARVAGHERREAIVAGLPFFEVVSVTRLEGGVADNVVPGSAVATLNLRYPPDRTPTEAEDVLRALLPTDATVEIVGQLAARETCRSTRRSCSRCRRPATSRSRRSRRGRTSPTSPRAGSPRSTSAPGDAIRARRRRARRDRLARPRLRGPAPGRAR